MLSSHGWEKLLEEDNLAAIERLVERFSTPLQGAEANTGVIKEEFAGMIEHAVQYIAVASLDYHSVVVETSMRLIQPNGQTFLFLPSFSSPFQHQMLERVFSTLGMVKADKHSCLTNLSLDDLLLLNSAKMPVADFHPDPSID